MFGFAVSLLAGSLAMALAAFGHVVPGPVATVAGDLYLPCTLGFVLAAIASLTDAAPRPSRAPGQAFNKEIQHARKQ